MKNWTLISGIVFLLIAFGIEAYTYFQQGGLMQVASNIPAVEALAYIDSVLWMLPLVYILSTVLIVLGLVIPKNADLNKLDIKNEKNKEK